MSLYEIFETNKEAEKSGVWIEVEKEVAFLLSRMTDENKKYSKMLEARTRPIRRRMDLGTLPKEESDRIFMEIFIATILLDWKGVTDREGNILVFTKENAMKLFTDLPDLYKQLVMAASEASTFRELSLENEAKNL